ncbi:hypothetical protein [Nonomuraea sp. NPDC049646]|uniref:hypothetical protein n=1 Tax=unclassified Nonomuraea TaxID=2593643 RepID=UPI0037923367
MTDAVIDLRTRSTYRPDCATLARNKLLLARTGLGMSYTEFAGLLSSILGWYVRPDALEAWETATVPPGDVLVAVSAVSPAAADRVGVRSHKFIAAYVGERAAGKIRATGASTSEERSSVEIHHPTGTCDLYVWPHGVAIFHLVEELDVPNIANLAVWRYRSYSQNLDWATRQLRQLAGDESLAAGYVLSLYWLHTPTWVGRVLDTALRIMCAPRVLVERERAGDDDCLPQAEHAERELLSEGFEHQEMRTFGLAGVSLGYASWSGLAYHPLDPARCLAEHELVAYELSLQAVWAYCDYINRQVEQGHDPDVGEGYGWRFLRAARSKLTNPRPQETGQHRSMREAAFETSGLAGHLHQAIEVLREAGKQ